MTVGVSSLRMSRVTVGVGWTRAWASNPSVGQVGHRPFARRVEPGAPLLSGRVGRVRVFVRRVWPCALLLFERIGRVRVFVRRVESDKEFCSSGRSTRENHKQNLGLGGRLGVSGWIGQSILSDELVWVIKLCPNPSPGLTRVFWPWDWVLGFGRVELKKSVRIQLDGHTMNENYPWYLKL